MSQLVRNSATVTLPNGNVKYWEDVSDIEWEWLRDPDKWRVPTAMLSLMARKTSGICEREESK